MDRSAETIAALIGILKLAARMLRWI